MSHRLSKKGVSMASVATYWKAIVALLGALSTGLATVLADPNAQSVLPDSWQKWLAVVAGGGLTSVVTMMKRNEVTVEQAELALRRAFLQQAIKDNTTL